MLHLLFYFAGILCAAVGLMLGGWLAVLPTALLAAVSGAFDGQRASANGWISTWFTALLGALVPPICAIGRDLVRVPAPPDLGLAVSVGLAFLAVGTVVFVAIAMASQFVARRLANRRRKASVFHRDEQGTRETISTVEASTPILEGEIIRRPITDGRRAAKRDDIIDLEPMPNPGSTNPKS